MSLDQQIEDVSPQPGTSEIQRKVISVGTNKLTTLAESRTARLELAIAITTLIRNYENRTNCLVREVRKVESAHNADKYVVEVKL